MADTRYDCIVLGTGGVGSAALYHLASRGLRVLGLDQFPPGHDQGSSHGDTRIIRLVYFEHPDYVPLLRRAFDLWQQLGEQTTLDVFKRCGILQAGPGDGDVIQGLRSAAEAHRLELNTLDEQDIAEQFPGFDIGDDLTVLFDPNGGILRVEDCIRAHVSLAKAAGASLVIGDPVVSWQQIGDSVEVKTKQSTYQCNKLIVTPGPWAAQQLPALSQHFQLLRKSQFWFDNDAPEYLLSNNCPVFLFEHGKHTFYGFPQVDEKGLKIADHAGGRFIKSPKKVDRTIDTEELESVSLFLRQYLPKVGHQLNHHVTCMYTMSPDGHFIVGQYPDAPNVQFAAGLSGHGFKFATVLGEALTDLTLHGQTDLPIDFLSPERLFRN
jgi:sarcosine oxidase